MAAPESQAVAGGLSDGIYHAWGAIREAARTPGGLPELPSSQVAVLRRLVEHGPAKPAKLADDLGVARPTISNALRNLEAEGLIERLASKSDGRSVLAVPTRRATEVLERFGRQRRTVVQEAYESLSTEDQAALASAVEPLARLVATVRSRETDSLPDDF